MSSSEFPPFVKSLPQADLPVAGQRGWLLQSKSGQILFLESDVEVLVPEHSHGDEWGIVLNGKIELIIDDKTQTYTHGDTFFIPAGTKHQPHIYPGYRVVGYFADPDRYHPRSPQV